MSVQTHKHVASRSAGFTLIEIMVVVVILGILGAIIVPNVIDNPDRARVTAAYSDIRSMGGALDYYRLDNQSYPTTEQGLEALVSKPSGFPEPKNYNPEGYIRKLKDDPWGSPYIYTREDRKFEIYSLGADGAEGGEGFSQDIRYSDL